MKESLLNLAFEVELKPGERLMLPERLIQSVKEGRWIIIIQPATPAPIAIRDHTAFLMSYAPEDEGLYDDYPSR